MILRVASQAKHGESSSKMSRVAKPRITRRPSVQVVAGKSLVVDQSAGEAGVVSLDSEASIS